MVFPQFVAQLIYLATGAIPNPPEFLRIRVVREQFFLMAFGYRVPYYLAILLAADLIDLPLITGIGLILVLQVFIQPGRFERLVVSGGQWFVFGGEIIWLALTITIFIHCIYTIQSAQSVLHF